MAGRTPKSGTLSLRLPASLWAQLDAKAKEDEVSTGEALCAYLTQALEGLKGIQMVKVARSENLRSVKIDVPVLNEVRKLADAYATINDTIVLNLLLGGGIYADRPSKSLLKK